MARVAINGFGRIGRQSFKAMLEHYPDDLEIVAINDLTDNETLAHLLRHDSTYGAFDGDVSVTSDRISVTFYSEEGDERQIDIVALEERDPAKLPWRDLGIDIVIESTGRFTEAEKARAHLQAGARKVIITAPAKGEDITICLGVNEDRYDNAVHHIISNASCTTNGLAPVVKVIVDNLGLVKGQMTTIHSYTNSQQILDKAAGKDLREMRAGALNIVPTSTGAARALKLVIPEVDGKLDGLAYRVPTPTVSIVEVVALTEKETTVDALNDIIRETAAEKMKGILGITMDPVVSMDLKGDERSSIVDGLCTNVVGGNLVKVAAWYDNEWGYACRLADLAAFVAEKGL